MAENAISEDGRTVEERITDYLEAEEAPQEEEERREPEKAEEPGQSEEPEEAEEPEASEEPETDDVESVEISSWQELADHVGVEPADLYNLTIPVTGADGQRKEVSLGEWKDSFQATEKVNAEKARIEQERAAFEQEVAQKKQEMEEKFFHSAKMIEAAERQLVGGYDDAYMEQLRMSNPAEYAAMKQDHMERMNAINGMKQQLSQEYAQYQEKVSQESQAERQKWLEQQNKSLSEYVPEWTDQETRTKESGELAQYLVSKGYDQKVIATNLGARDIELARKAMLYDRQQKSKPEMKKKVVSIGKKVLKSGKSKSKSERKHDRVSQDYREFQKRGTVDDAAAFIEKHLLGDF
jgi:hypothetical protein